MTATDNAGRDRQPSHRSFAALRDPGFRQYFLYSALAMMADSIEHVISYWVVFQKFHSPALGGYAILSHWLPMLLFGVMAGALADRYDPRRLIQIGMLLFMGCSLAWGVLFFTDSLQAWHSVVILTVLKVFGDTPSPGMMSFPKPGITLALDFPIKPYKSFPLFARLADMTLEFGGRLYPAKDAAMTAEQFQSFYPQWEQFARYRDPMLTSSFWERVTGDKPGL